MVHQSFLSLLLLPVLALAAPVRFAPVKRASDVLNARAVAKDAYIVALKPNTVDPEARGEWLTKVLAEGNVKVSDAQLEQMNLNWSATVFNGIGGTLSTKAVKVLSAQPEVAYIQEGSWLVIVVAARY